MDFDEARNQIMSVLSNIQQKDTESTLHWLKNVVIDMLDDQFSKTNEDVMINQIREDIRTSLPVEAVTGTETIVQPSVGPNADCEPASTVHVDGFLYDDDAIDDLCDRGLMSRNYCTNCGSRAVKPLTFVTHSASISQIKFIFQYLLKDLRGHRILDVGSRTGALLYGAYLYGEADQITGVEIDSTFCELQRNIVEKYKFGERITIVNSDIREQADLLKSSDFVILNNVFEFFMPLDVQLKLWTFLCENIRKKQTVLITVPSIEESLASIHSTIDISSWVQPIKICPEREAATLKLFPSSEDSDLSDICMYRVL